jgi:hypothetical protein
MNKRLQAIESLQLNIRLISLFKTNLKKLCAEDAPPAWEWLTNPFPGPIAALRRMDEEMAKA